MTHITAANKQKVKELVRQGIPDSYRGIAWQVLLNSLNIYKTNEKNEQTSKYCSFLGKPVSEKTLIQIGKDIDRTQPLMKFFRSEHQLRSLFRILKAYAAYNTHVDYCQGMGFPASILLYYMPEKQAFWAFLQMMNKIDNMFRNSLQGVHERCKVLELLLKKCEPKIYHHLQVIKVEPQLYACGWLMSCFINAFEFPVAMRVFEQFLCEGDKALYRASIAILKYASYSLPHLKMSRKPEDPGFEQEFDQMEKGENGVSLLCMPTSAAIMFV